MLPDLQRLISLQRLETDRTAAERIVQEVPERQAALDERAAEARAAVEAAKAHHASLSAERREAEKQLAAAEARLAKFRDQQSAVKTNKEYQAMLHEIDMAKADVDKWQEVVILRMDDVDAAAAALKAQDALLRAAEGEIAEERAALEAERAEAEGRVAALAAEREGLASEIEDPRALQIFDGLVKSRKTVALSQAIDGLCIECRVRLRPQVFAEVRRNDALRQCDNCQRLLYYVPPSAARDEEKVKG